MPYIIIDKDDNILEVVATIEEANRKLKLVAGARCERVMPLEDKRD